MWSKNKSRFYFDDKGKYDNYKSNSQKYKLKCNKFKEFMIENIWKVQKIKLNLKNQKIKTKVDQNCKSEFDAKFIFHNVFGRGIYFTKNPNISVKIRLESFKFVLSKYIYQKDNQYYIVPDVELLRPLL
ncbi:hypothetical protein M0811_02849 [Anaeramoeba ignava]|uniref:Uncharacterized protein n=1 Tax=Anaeramoeba ignava TaxID=1746090 RepID=A0A9Q0R5Y6_ANAIG|nr:hypothetical protein M0811_02849 [Anaeramoeba ignava]